MKTKILILLKTFDGGTGTFVNDLLMMKNNVSFKVACLEKGNIKSIKNISFFTKNELYPDQYVFSRRLIIRLYRELLWLQKICKDYNPNIILTIDAHCLLLATVCKLFLDSKTKLVATIHNNLEAVVNYKAPLHLKTLINKLISMALNRADRTVCVSVGLAKNLFIKYKLHTE
ncbi:MAG: glycosyltransferase family 4 protein, partial [Chitinophagales bacterium]|nr:glycosyltransferase family 4 protein [Chitinophagales bacterium]